MKGIRSSIVINAEAEEIWGMLSSKRIVEWMPYMASSKKVEYITSVSPPDDLYQVGTITIFDEKCHYEVVENDEYSKLVYKNYEKNSFGYFEGYTIFALKKVKNGTLFIYAVAFHKPEPSSILMKIIANRITLQHLRNRMDEELLILKSLVE